MQRFWLGLVVGGVLGVAGTAAVVVLPDAFDGDNTSDALASSLKRALGSNARASRCEHQDSFVYYCEVAYGDKGVYQFQVTLKDDHCWSALFQGAGGPSPHGCLPD